MVRKSRSPDFDIDDTLTEMLTGFGGTVYDVTASLRAVESPEDPQQWTDDDRERTKPIVLVANKADIAPDGNVDRLRDGTDTPVVAATADGELALRTAADAGVIEYNPGDADFDVVAEISDAQRDALETIRDVMVENEGVGVQGAIDTAVYDTLDMITIYPVQNEIRWTDGGGETLPDAFLLPRGSTPKDLAYAVHSDIGDGYLHTVDARSDRRIGEDHEFEEGDVVKIVTTAN